MTCTANSNRLAKVVPGEVLQVLLETPGFRWSFSLDVDLRSRVIVGAALALAHDSMA
eukprot:CAMPEP_0170630008 /NCGR_PEP_ID=MMETSP0224-20130122/33702_1 /TAXON_ID=285029 /ORGANISM="Togula jolla, Strain CCCM 725" /LENGTH=56 /DNA_ID=CAMNT_0010957899 /DNA_START=559 /DNA_END=725 /DNA_ORIENTATION=+